MIYDKYKLKKTTGFQAPKDYEAPFYYLLLIF